MAHPFEGLTVATGDGQQGGKLLRTQDGTNAMTKVKRGQGSPKHGNRLRSDVTLLPHQSSRKLGNS